MNQTLIHFDFEMNPGMSLSNVRQIKEYLVRNKAAYDAERFEEYLERRQMRREEEEMDILMNNEAAGRLEMEAIEERQHARMEAREELWKQELEEYEMMKEQKIKELEDAYRMRKDKKKPKKRGGKKKKAK